MVLSHSFEVVLAEVGERQNTYRKLGSKDGKSSLRCSRVNGRSIDLMLINAQDFRTLVMEDIYLGS